jgi:hypothetical protein
MDEDCPFVFCCLDPFEGNRVVFGNITTHVQDDISISKINIMIGHCTTSIRLCQSRNSGAVSDTGLVLNVDETQGPEEL